MNILFVSQSALDTKKSFGNTICNWFDGQIWYNDNFSHFYVRKQNPDNNLKVNYYNLPATEIVKGIFKFNIKGKFFTYKDFNLSTKEIIGRDKEKKSIEKLHDGKAHNLVYFIHELIWMSEIWINKHFKKFINENSPDVLFAFATSPYILWPIIKYLKKKNNCKIVLFIADDVFGNFEENVFYRKIYLKYYFKKCINIADKLYAVSNEMSMLYQNRFKKNITTLYKGCDFSTTQKKSLNFPIRIVYAGNLLWGRDDTLVNLIDALKEINKKDKKVLLEIYTGTEISERLKSKLNVEDVSIVMGVRSYDEIKHIMSNSDITLHIESFNEQQKKLVKYSFSTKIIDCLQSGTQVVGIGPKGIASIEYLRNINGAIVIDTIEDIASKMLDLIDNENMIIENKKSIREYAKINHDLFLVQKQLKKDLCSLM